MATAKKETARGGADMMDPGLAFAGFEPDPIDDEDFSGADRGHVLPSDDEIDAQRKANEEAGEGEVQVEVVDKTGQAPAEGDEESVDAAAAKAAADKARAEDPDSEDEAEAEEEAPEASAEEETPEIEAESEVEAKPKGQMIPKSRFDEVNERRKRAEEELTRLRAESEAGEQAQAEEYDFETKEKEYMEHVLDGEHDKAVALRAEIRAAEKASFMQDARSTSDTTTQEAFDRQAILEHSATVIAEYPVFDHQDEANFRSDLLEDVSLHTNLYVEKGLSRPDAFKHAVRDVIKLNDLTALTAPEQAVPEAKPKKRTSTKEKVKIASEQPANIATAGKSGSDAGLNKIDVNKITDADLDKLPAETVARLRGDYVG